LTLGAFPSQILHAEATDLAESAQLENVMRILFLELPEFRGLGSEGISWALQICPSLDPNRTSGQTNLESFLEQFQDEEMQRSLDRANFANYLCCLVSFFSPIDRRLMAQMDKRCGEMNFLIFVVYLIRVSIAHFNTV
jgi:hypothetical protein